MAALDTDPDAEPTRRQWLGFWCMIAQQTHNAFNDKAAQFLLVPLAGAVGASVFGIGVESAAGVMIALPFVLFAPLAGWLSDRYSKRNVLVAAAVAQLVILTWLWLSVRAERMELALWGFFALAVQSAFFSPAKIGINKELVGHRHLGFAAGIQQMTVLIAILVGQIAAGIIFDQRWDLAGRTTETSWHAAALPLLVLLLAAIPAIGAALLIPRTPAHGAEKLTPKLLVRHFAHVRDLWRDTNLRRASFAVAFFWGFAAFINLWSIKIAKVLTGGLAGFGPLSSWFMGAASIGMIVGFGLSAQLLRKRIELGWVPVAGIAMAITALVVAGINPTPTLALLGPDPFSKILDPETSVFLWALAALAFSSALFLTPLNAWMQDRYPPARRGELQAAVNLQSCLAGIVAAVFVEFGAKLLVVAGLSPLAAYRVEIVIAAFGCALITGFIIRMLPADFIRILALTAMRPLYRIRPIDAENIPRTGGALLLPNHISWADSFFLSAAAPRPVRFVMDASFMKIPAVAAFCRTFQTLPIDLGNPREAIRATAEALRNGDLVCLFPEGQLSRTGSLQALKRGCELIARQSGAPVIPVWADGIWGSIFSYERNRFFTKIPYPFPRRIHVAFAPPLAPKKATLPNLRAALEKASATAIAKRPEASDPARANGYQLGQLNALPRRGTIHHLPDDPLPPNLPGLAAFGKRFRTRIIPSSEAASGIPWIGGEILRQRILSGQLPPAADGSVFHDLSGQAAEPMEIPGWTHCPGLAVGGLIVSLSLPPIPLARPDTAPQTERKAGSLGILLPGFHRGETDFLGTLTLHGPACPDGGISLPVGLQIDDEGFLFPASSPP